MSSVTVPNVIIIIVMVCIPLVAAVISMVIMCLLQSPIDYNQAWIPKIVVIIAMIFISCMPMMLPIDVSNLSQAAGLTNVTPILWQVIFGMVTVLCVIVLPFAIFYYESKTTSDKQGMLRQCCVAFVMTAIVLIIYAIIIGVTYYWLGICEIPLITEVETQYKSSLTAANSAISCTYNCGSVSSTMSPRMSIILYFIAWISIAGWIVFVFAGACGFFSLPINCFTFAITRKIKLLNAHEYRQAQKIMVKETKRLMDIAITLDEDMKAYRWIPNAKNLRAYQIYKKDVTQLQDDFKLVERCAKDAGGSIFYIVGALIASVFTMLLTLTWIVHIFCWLVYPELSGGPPLNPILNTFLTILEGVTPLLSWSFYALFIYYVVIVTLWGVYRFSNNIPFINIYPLRYRDTLMNGLLINCGVMLVASVTIIQFSAEAFSGYARYTSIDALFNTYVNNMIYIKYFFEYVDVAFFAMILLGLFFSIMELVFWRFIARYIPFLNGGRPKGVQSNHELLMALIDSAGKKLS